jgi:hypothetical protein
MKSLVLIGLFCLLLLFPTGWAQNGAISDATPMNQTPTAEGTSPSATLVRQKPTPTVVLTEITKEAGSGSITEKDMHLTIRNTVGDVVNHPAFERFGQFILPLGRGRYENAMPLENVASLLPYHSNIDPNVVVNSINHMIDMAASVETIFYDFTRMSW